ncbi:MAG: cytochrome b/b6 domain-containing protein [Rhodospirillaceae bacterium]|nr:cytochrome b/b6 domain-containing protein [Rhodospirillaceae bacterium]
MTMPASDSRIAQPAYDRASMVFHWLVAVIVVEQSVTGFLFYRLEFDTSLYNAYYYWHRSLGEVAFMLAVLYVAWRRFRAPVAEWADVRWRATAAILAHRLLLALLVLVPLSKLWRGAYGIGWQFFDFKIAAPFPPHERMAALLSDAHYVTSILLLAVAAVHAVAALWHHHVHKDRLLQRMLPHRPLEPT